MTKGSGRVPDGTGLSQQAATPLRVDGPPGFDPSRWQWESGPCVNRLGQVVSYDINHPQEPGSSGVCVVASCFEGEAVARFIAAAPRLYAALRAAVDDATGKPNVWFFDAKDALELATTPDAALHRFGFARGNYSNTCMVCREHFVGANRSAAHAPPRQREARRAETAETGSVGDESATAEGGERPMNTASQMSSLWDTAEKIA